MFSDFHTKMMVRNNRLAILKVIGMALECKGLHYGQVIFEFYIIASPSAAYFNGTLKVLIERQLKRACQGGSGMAKMAGNYGSTFLASKRAAQQGCGLSLWLDAQHGRYAEACSAMIFFALRPNTTGLKLGYLKIMNHE